MVRWVNIRNAFLGLGYRFVVRPLFFLRDPEAIHNGISALGHALGLTAVGRAITWWSFGYRHPSLAQTIAGITFPNPVGLSAGFDKEGRLVDILPSVGFGFMEIGSITGQPSPGNPKPRLWRLPAVQSLVVHYGLNSSGSAVVAERLRHRRFTIPLGVNVAKANIAATDDLAAGIADYRLAMTNLAGLGQYWTINISCPNTSGGEPFTDPANLDRLLAALAELPDRRPKFLKLPADIADERLDALVDVASKHGLTGFVCTNLTKNRAHPLLRHLAVPPQGGLSGRVVADRADAVLARVYRRVGPKHPIIGVGGIFTAADAYRKIRLGASLVALVTGMIYGGPQTISQITSGLVELLRRDGLTLRQAIGRDAATSTTSFSHSAL